MGGQAPANQLRLSLPGAGRVKPDRNLGAAKPPSARRFANLRPKMGLGHGTAVYGPVRTVVWGGRSRKAPPYPDRFETPHRSAPPPAPVERVVHVSARAAPSGRHDASASREDGGRDDRSEATIVETPGCPSGRAGRRESPAAPRSGWARSSSTGAGGGPIDLAAAFKECHSAPGAGSEERLSRQPFRTKRYLAVLGVEGNHRAAVQANAVMWPIFSCGVIRWKRRSSRGRPDSAIVSSRLT